MTKLTFDTLSQNLINNFAQTRPMRANTLLLTVYGDFIAPYYNGRLWLGSLIKLVNPLGISQRLVRTSVFRLAERGILESQRIAKRSYYTLTPIAQRQFTHASGRIYTSHIPTWDGQWRIVMSTLGVLETHKRKALKKELEWLGFSKLVQGTYIHPLVDMKTVKTILDDLQISDQVVLLNASEATQQSMPLIRNQLEIQAMDAPYRTFFKKYKPIVDAIEKSDTLSLETCFLVRTLLINEYRSILLHEPDLPLAFWKKDSLVYQARRIVKRLYLRLQKHSDDYFIATTQAENELKSPPPSYHARFKT